MDTIDIDQVVSQAHEIFKIAILSDEAYLMPMVLNEDNIFASARPEIESNLSHYLEEAVNLGSINVLRFLLSYKPIDPNHHVDINQIIFEDSGHTLLNYVCDFYGSKNPDLRFEVIKLLLDLGANPNISDADNWTPLHNAAFYRYPDIIPLLLTHHANPNSRATGDLSSFDCLIQELIETESNPTSEMEDIVLACVPVLLEHHAEAYCEFYENAESLGFTRVTALLDSPETKKASCPIHILATYESKDTIVDTLKTLSFNDFKLKDAHGNTPSDIARRMNDVDDKIANEVADVLEKYEAVYNRSQLMKTNYESSGHSLHPAIPRCIIASFLPPREFGFFTAATNMHISRNEQQSQNIENDVNSSSEDDEIVSSADNSQTNSQHRLFSSTQNSNDRLENNSDNDKKNESKNGVATLGSEEEEKEEQQSTKLCKFS